ncbi:MAG: DUF6502 family protein [Gammaproteobacteria bacterium]|jgi:hypothetical protein
MSTKQQHALFSAVRLLLRPLVRILIRNGVAHGAFAELTKKVFVDVAFDEFSPDGKKQTVSRVSAQTGLTRKEVKRLHELQQTDDSSSQARYNRAVRVISGWMNDASFLDGTGKPAELPISGEHPSFEELVRQYSGDIPTRAMLSMLVDGGSVKQINGRVRLIRHAYVAGSDPVEKLDILGSDVFELIATIDHNMTADPGDLRFQRKVSYDNIDPDALGKLRKMSARKAQALLEQLNRQYAENEQGDGGGQGKTISLGIYYHEQDSSGEPKP